MDVFNVINLLHETTGTIQNANSNLNFEGWVILSWIEIASAKNLSLHVFLSIQFLKKKAIYYNCFFS